MALRPGRVSNHQRVRRNSRLIRKDAETGGHANSSKQPHGMSITLNVANVKNLSVLLHFRPAY